MSGLSNRVFVVTGANAGIGKVTALELARGGGRVWMACRSESKAKAAIAEIKAQKDDADVHYVHLDLGSLASVKACAEELLEREPELHVLINNAGIAGLRGETQDGFELAFGINHLGHFLLTVLLLERLKASAPARIVNVSSGNHYKVDGIDFGALRQSTPSVSGLPEYSVSKLANVLFAKELARRLQGTGVTTYSLHPGTVATEIWKRVPWPLRSIMKMFMLSNEEGAQTTLHCAISPDVAGESGLYYTKCKVKEPNPAAKDEALAEELWKRSEEWVREYL